MFVESLSELEEDFLYNYIFPTMVSKRLFFKTSQVCFYAPLMKNDAHVSYTGMDEAP